MKQEKNIDYFQIEGTPGGNQEWCTDFWMYLGGCGALAACDLSICLARNYGLKKCYPGDALNLTRKEYVDFSMKNETLYSSKSRRSHKTFYVYRWVWTIFKGLWISG